MAKVNLTKLLSSIKGQLSNSSKVNVKRLIPDASITTDATFAAAITPEYQAMLGTLAKTLGVKYQGKTLDIWEGDDSFGCRLPTIYSDGKRPVVDWAGQVVPLSGTVKGSFIGSELRIDSAKASLRLPVRLSWENDKQRETALDTLSDLEQWEEVFPLLKIQAAWLKREELFDGSIKRIECLEVEHKEGQTGPYWSITGDGGNAVFKFSMPDKANPTVGDIVGVNPENKTLVLNGEVFQSVTFVKVTELEVGMVYQCHTLKEKTGEYPGWTLAIEGVGLVDGNSQINRWIENTGVVPVMVSPDHPIEIKVLDIRKGNNGKMTARLSLDLLDDSIGLSALLGATPTSSAKIETPTEEEVVDIETPPLFEGANTDSAEPDDEDDWL